MTWLLCDYGEVLCLPQSPADRSAIEAASERPAADLWSGYWAHRLDYDRGDLTVEEYWAAVLGHRRSAAQVRLLADLDAASWIHPNRPTLAAAERAEQRGMRLAIFSNAPHEIADTVDSLDWVAGFSPRLFSCRVRAVKPEPAAYAAVLIKLEARPEEVLFLDDRPTNVAAARRLGIRAEVFTDPAQIDRIGDQSSSGPP